MTNGLENATSGPRWPTAHDINAAFDALDPGLDAIHDLAGPPGGHYGWLVSPEGPREDGFWLRESVPVPSYKDVGVLAVFMDRLRAEIDELVEISENLAEVMRAARMNGLVDDDDVARNAPDDIFASGRRQ